MSITPDVLETESLDHRRDAAGLPEPPRQRRHRAQQRPGRRLSSFRVAATSLDVHEASNCSPSASPQGPRQPAGRHACRAAGRPAGSRSPPPSTSPPLKPGTPSATRSPASSTTTPRPPRATWPVPAPVIAGAASLPAWQHSRGDVAGRGAGVPSQRDGGRAAGSPLERPMTGWDLIAAAQERIGQFWTLTQSQVYRARWPRPGRGRPARTPGSQAVRGNAGRPRGLRRVARERARRGPGAHSAAADDRVRRAPALGPAGGDHRGPPRRACRAARAVPRRPRMADGGRRGRRGAPGTLEFGIRHEQAVLDWFDVLPGILAPS